MTRREMLIAVAGIASTPFALCAQPARRLPRLGFLHPASAEASAVYKALIPGLGDRGYLEGKNIALDLAPGTASRKRSPPWRPILCDPMSISCWSWARQR
jgi:hypothetical protein